MTSVPKRRRRWWGGVAAATALEVLLLVAGCEPSATVTDPGPRAAVLPTPEPAATLPDVTVTLRPTTQTGAEMTGYAWYLTSVKDPVRGIYTAAVERRSLTRLWFDVADEGEQRASIVLPLHDGRPAGLILSIEHGRFVCAAEGKGNVCTVRVSVDGGAPRPVPFIAPRRAPLTTLRLASGDDARRLLTAIGKGKRLRIQPTFEEEGSPEIEFGLNGLNPVIARLTKRSVAATAKVAAATPGA